ncbi:MAG: hypothetical protein LLF92_11310 [Planctomycetaceae bacterium]|nr:hypothetical protein [Planctomycetaceae bacterium]
MKKRRAVLLSIVFCIICASFVRAEDELFPMQVGKKYIYTQSNPMGSSWTAQLLINRQATLNGHTYFNLKGYNFNNEPESDYGLLRSTIDEIYDGNERLEYKKAPVGTKWSVYQPEDIYYYKFIEVVGIESVTVPFGTFSGAYKFKKYMQVDVNDANQGQSPYWYEWVVPGVGLVKQEDYWVDDAPVIQELTGITTTFSGGTGTVRDPYLIATVADMNTFGAQSDKWNKYFQLANDINMAGYTGTQFKIVGTSSVPFIGVFDGNGHTIKNLNYTNAAPTNYAGLFGYTSGATIKNVVIENVNIDANSMYVGGLVGYQYYGTITNCHITGAVSSTGAATSYVGGLVGWQSYGTITNCYSTAEIICSSVNAYAGGLIGYQSHGDVTDSYSSGTVTAYSSIYSAFAGGLIGYQFSGSAAECFSNGNVASSSSSSSAFAGGLAGYQSYGALINCYCTGNVSCGTLSSSAYAYAGGLVGRQYNYSTAKIQKCYSIGTVAATGAHTYKGGFLGYYGGSGIISESFWDKDTSVMTGGLGYGTSAGVAGKTTVLMQTRLTFTGAGWDFKDETTNGTADIWQMPKKDYPRFAWENIGSNDPNADPNEQLNGEYWFGNFAGARGTVTIYDNDTWEQNWSDIDGQHSFTKTFTMSEANDGSYDVIFPDGTYNIAWSGNTIVHIDPNAGMDIMIRKPDDITGENIAGEYTFFNHHIYGDVDGASGGKIVYKATSSTSGTADYNVVNVNGSTSTGTMNWLLGTDYSMAVTGGYSPALVGDGGVIFTPYRKAGINGYTMAVKKTAEKITPADIAGIYQMRCFATDINGNYMTVGNGIGIFRSDSTMEYTLRYPNGNSVTGSVTSDGKYDFIPSAIDTDGDGIADSNAGNVISFKKILYGTISPKKDMIFMPMYEYGDNRGIGQAVGAIIWIKCPQQDMPDSSDINDDGIVNFEDFTILAREWFENCDAEDEWCNGADIDHSGKVDGLDLLQIANDWLEYEYINQ